MCSNFSDQFCCGAEGALFSGSAGWSESNRNSSYTFLPLCLCLCLSLAHTQTHTPLWFKDICRHWTLELNLCFSKEKFRGSESDQHVVLCWWSLFQQLFLSAYRSVSSTLPLASVMSWELHITTNPFWSIVCSHRMAQQTGPKASSNELGVSHEWRKFLGLNDGKTTVKVASLSCLCGG